MQKIIGFNHISEKLMDDEVIKLMNLYKNYHKLHKCYLWKYKKLRRLKLALELSSIGLTTIGTIAGSITLNPIILSSIAGPGIMIQAYLTKSDLNKRVDRCLFACNSYEKVLVQLKSFLRGLSYDQAIFLSDLRILDDIVVDQAPNVDKYSERYSKKFIE